jgi:hypothetical protein
MESQMSFLRFFKRPFKIGGEIGFHGLEDWWIKTFTGSERSYIEREYNPLSVGGDLGYSLTRGEILSTSQTASQLLCGLASWFTKEDDFSIGERIIEKSIALSESDILDRHFAYNQAIEIFYRHRNDPTSLAKAIHACESQIAIAPQAARAFHKEYRGEPLPEHRGFKQLAIIRSNELNDMEVVRVCKQAKLQGWAGDWDKRISMAEKMIEKSNPKN